LQFGLCRQTLPRLEFKYQAKQYENWEVVAWEGDTHLKMKAWINGATSYDQEAELTRVTSDWWTLRLGKKTIARNKSTRAFRSPHAERPAQSS